MSFKRKDWEKRNKPYKHKGKGQRFDEQERQDKGNDRQATKQALKKAA